MAYWYCAEAAKQAKLEGKSDDEAMRTGFAAGPASVARRKRLNDRKRKPTAILIIQILFLVGVVAMILIATQNPKKKVWVTPAQIEMLEKMKKQ